MRAHLTAAASAALLLGLVGCSAAPEEAPVEEPAASAETTQVEPLTAEPVEEEATAGTPEEAYLAAMRERLAEDRPPIEATQIPNATDEQLLEAAAAACEQLASGTVHDEVRVIEGEQPNQLNSYTDSGDIALYASEYICTDYQL